MNKHLIIAFLLCIVSQTYLQAQKQPVKKPTQAEIAKAIEQTKKDMTICIGSSKHKPGFGNSKDKPEGLELKLDPCITLIPSKKFNPNDTLVGTSSAFIVPILVRICGEVCRKKHGKTSGGLSPVFPVELPPGLMITSDVGGAQNGLLVEDVYFTVPNPNLAGNDSACIERTINVAVACINQKRTNFGFVKVNDKESLTNDYFDATGLYSIGKVTNDSNLQKFMAVLAKYPKLKQIKNKFPSRLAVIEAEGRGETYANTKGQEILAEIQSYLWKITDGPGITCGELRTLEEKLAFYK